MNSTIAMAGLAEVAWYYAQLVFIGLLSVVTGLLMLACWKRWPLVAGIACTIWMLSGLLLQPWAAFAPPATADPDEAYWLGRWRVASVLWITVFLIGVVCLGFILRYSKPMTNEPKPSP
jgi:hypothetical protein